MKTALLRITAVEHAIHYLEEGGTSFARNTEKLFEISRKSLRLQNYEHVYTYNANNGESLEIWVVR